MALECSQTCCLVPIFIPFAQVLMFCFPATITGTSRGASLPSLLPPHPLCPRRCRPAVFPAGSDYASLLSKPAVLFPCLWLLSRAPSSFTIGLSLFSAFSRAVPPGVPGLGVRALAPHCTALRPWEVTQPL